MRKLLLAALFAASMTLAFGQDGTVDGITFASDPGSVYVPLREVAKVMGWNVGYDGKNATINDRPIQKSRFLLDGTRLIPVRSLESLGCAVDGIAQDGFITISKEDKTISVSVSDKRVEINKKAQKLRAFQGNRLVAETNISTGKPGFTTPSGHYTAGPEKSRLRYSRKYNNAPMPWSVQIVGGYFMHGYTSVPRYPASHGCVRLPLWGANPARWLFEWIDLGTPIAVANVWETAVSEDSTDTIPVKGGGGKKTR